MLNEYLPISMNANGYSSFLINKHQELYGKGNNQESQLGIGNKNNRQKWTEITFFDKKEITLISKTKDKLNAHTFVYTMNQNVYGF